MVEWCMAHPWLTFWIVIVALFVLENAVTNIIRFCNNCLRASLAKRGIKVRDMESKAVETIDSVLDGGNKRG